MIVLKKFCLSVSALRTADVLLFSRGKNVVHSAIDAVIRSDFAHAALYYGEGMILEAIPGGVIKRSIVWDLYSPTDSVKVLRVKEEIESRLDPNFAKLIIETAEMYLYLPYFLRGAWLSIFKGVPIEDVSQFFCSHLVAKAYYAVNLEIKRGVPPEKIHPGDIEHSTIFKEVKGAVEVVNAKYFPYPIRLDPRKEEAKKFQQIHRKVSDRLRKEGLRAPINAPDVFTWLALLKGTKDVIAKKVDDVIVQALHEEMLYELVNENDVTAFSLACAQDLENLTRAPDIDGLKEAVERLKQVLVALREGRTIHAGNADFLKKEHDESGGRYMSLLALYGYFYWLSCISDSTITIGDEYVQNLEQLLLAKRY